jgi:hypothetical protein
VSAPRRLVTLEAALAEARIVASRTLSAPEGLAALETASARFRAHTGALAPHFAYGPVGKGASEAVHAMHVANHLDALTV